MQINKKYKYYDGKSFNEFLRLRYSKKTCEAIEFCRQYLEKYPYDISAAVSYASLLINSGCLEEAEEVLDNISYTKNTVGYDMRQFIFTQIELLGCQNRFEECYSLLQENISKICEIREDYNFILLYLQKKLNLPISLPIDVEKYSYTMKQTLDYSEELALEYIKRHTNTNVSSKEKAIFIDSFPVEDYYFSFREKLPLTDYKRMFSGPFKNIYVFKYDHNGIYNGKSLDYFEIITLQDSNDIITMYPFDNKNGFPYIDITPKIEVEDDYRKVKRMSQIEKFNQRYFKN